jgi:hypothetical protein
VPGWPDDFGVVRGQGQDKVNTRSKELQTPVMHDAQAANRAAGSGDHDACHRDG